MRSEMMFVLGWILGFAFILTPLEVSSAPVCPGISAVDMVVLGLTYSCLPADSEFRPANGGDGRRVMEVNFVFYFCPFSNLVCLCTFFYGFMTGDVLSILGLDFEAFVLFF